MHNCKAIFTGKVATKLLFLIGNKAELQPCLCPSYILVCSMTSSCEEKSNAVQAETTTPINNNNNSLTFVSAGLGGVTEREDILRPVWAGHQ